MTSKFPDRCFAFDQFGPLSIRPTHGAAWAPVNRPDRLPATYHRTHGVRYLHGCYSLGDDQLWGITRRRKGADHTLAALKTIRAARPDAAPIYVILDNLSANKTPTIRAWAKRYAVELCLTPTQASWANPIEAQFGPLRTFVMGGSNPPNHTVLARALQAYLRWRNANTRHPDVLAAQRRERARIRSERQQRWGRPKTPAARSNPANVSGHRTSHATIGGDAGGGGGRAAGPGRRVGHAATGRRATHPTTPPGPPLPPTTVASGSGVPFPPVPPLPGPGLFDVAGRIRAAVNGWLRDLAASAIAPAVDLAARSVLATPDLAAPEGRVRELWGLSLGLANTGYVLLVCAGGVILMTNDTLQHVAVRWCVGRTGPAPAGPGRDGRRCGRAGRR